MLSKLSTTTRGIKVSHSQGLLIQVFGKFTKCEGTFLERGISYLKLQRPCVVERSYRYRTDITKVRCASTSAAATEVVSAVKCNDGERMLEVSWSATGTQSKFPYVWLRDNCLCKNCHHPISHARNFYMKDLDLDISPVDIDVSIYF